MEKVEIDDVRNEPNPLGVHGVRRPISDALGTDDVSMAFYELAPGEQFSGGLHAHHDQEEVFYVLAGTATFDVGTERESVTVEEGQLIRFPPGQFQSGRNETDDPVRALAIGAPGARHNWADLESLIPCPECGEVTSHGVREPTDDGRMPVYCNECGNELV
ncbi:cupin domain-containing protein [Halobacterium zhouii]|uniref:cupin domain-containing protein n=1 Tax=Halobacterium zhouii TaxID=2902624 RepID=UPI001E5E7BAD|nr:cupin domain-containing protein [Halobacterium zhouii]